MVLMNSQLVHRFTQAAGKTVLAELLGKGLSDEEMIQPGVAGQWSVRDNLAHIAAWDRAVTAGFREMLDGKRPDLIDLDDDAIDEFNLDNHRALLHYALDEVLAELHASREEMIEFLRDVDNTAALEALQSEPEAVGAYDHIPFASATAVFLMDTASEVFVIHRAQVITQQHVSGP